MLTNKFFRLYLFLGVTCWLAILGIGFFRNHIPPSYGIFITDILLCGLCAFIYLFFKQRLPSKKSHNFIENLWEVFIVGGSTILISLSLKFFFFLFGIKDYPRLAFLHDSLYLFNTGLMVVFLATGFYVWKTLILYKNKGISSLLWDIFEALVYVSILSNFIHSSFNEPAFVIAAIPITAIGLYLSFNLKWVAFLNYKQKWQSIALLFLILFILATFLQQILENRHDTGLIINLANNNFILANFAFLMLNCIVSLLVLFFHLPTSSVFEQKFGEVKIFHELTQTIHLGDKAEDVFKFLIDSSISTSASDAGWLEILNDKGNYEAFLNREINEFDVFEIKKVFRKNNINTDDQFTYIKNIKEYNHTEKINTLSLKSVLLVPLLSNNQKMGTLVLLKTGEDAYDKGMIEIIHSFVSQASLAIRNFRLVNEALSHERYKEELKIAKEVQKSLFPESLVLNINVEMSAFTKTADEVGGDYYDIYEYSDNQIVIVIGDVSGNGTSAAFNMAQMKGVFQSLVQLGLPADHFMNYANNALSHCLEKTSFITLSLFIIDIPTQTFQFARAGHCPALYFSASTNEVFYLQSKGLGLGIIRNKDYLKHIQKKEYQYSKGDIMVLYTDGVVEAHNAQSEEFGFERLKNILFTNKHLNTKQISNIIVDELYNFTGTRYLNDDYTFLVIKFI